MAPRWKLSAMNRRGQIKTRRGSDRDALSRGSYLRCFCVRATGGPPHQQWAECIRSMQLYSRRQKPVQSCSCWSSSSSSLNAAAGGKYALLPLCAPGTQRRPQAASASAHRVFWNHYRFFFFVFFLFIFFNILFWKVKRGSMRRNTVEIGKNNKRRLKLVQVKQWILWRFFK